MLNGCVKIFEKGELIRPFLASAAFPGIFSPVTIANGVYAEGGILDNFPVTPLKEICDQIIGVYISPIAKITPEKLKHSLNVLDRAIKINFSNSSQLKFSECDLVINPPSLSKYGLFDKNGIDEIFKIGYQTTLDKLREHKNLVALTGKYEN